MARVELPDGVRLNVEQHGPADAPATVVLLHGWTLDSGTWAYQIEELAAQGLRVIAYDARGHGRSTAVSRRDATLDRLGDDLAAVIGALAPEGPLVLAGHSLGGMTIMEYAERHRDQFAERVAGLVLISTTAEGDAHTAYGLPGQFTSLVRLAETTSAAVLARLGGWRPHRIMMPALRPGLRWLLFGHPCDPETMRIAEASLARAPLCSIGGFRPSVGSHHRLDTLAALAPVPTTVLVGDRDRLTPPACAESIAAAVPGAELIVLRGAGHMLTLERPDAVTRAITRAAKAPVRG